MPASVKPSDAGHSSRAHSKLSASGAPRWQNCPGSVKLSEGLPDKSTPWSEEGTRGHEVLEAFMEMAIVGMDLQYFQFGDGTRPSAEMWQHAKNARDSILKEFRKTPEAELFSEKKVYLDWIHSEMFGTYDAAIIDHFGTLHVYDYKYGITPVSPKENLQMIFYGLGLAHKYDWNFKKVRLWIIQPRVKGYDGPVFWEQPMWQFLHWKYIFETAVAQVKRKPDLYVEGLWCHYCKAKTICPLKKKKKLDEASLAFGP